MAVVKGIKKAPRRGISYILLDSEMNILLAFTTIWVMYNAYQNQISPFTPNIYAIFLVFRDDKENSPAVFSDGAVI